MAFRADPLPGARLDQCVARPIIVGRRDRRGVLRIACAQRGLLCIAAAPRASISFALPHSRNLANNRSQRSEFFPDQQRAMLRQMLIIRHFEERASADYHAAKIYGVMHCYIGQEAVAAGECSPELGRSDHLDPSRPRSLHCQRRRPQAHDGRALRPRNRLLQRQGRLHAYSRLRDRYAGCQRHRGGGISIGPARGLPRRWTARGASPCPSSATARPTPGRFTNTSTLPRYRQSDQSRCLMFYLRTGRNGCSKPRPPAHAARRSGAPKPSIPCLQSVPFRFLLGHPTGASR